VAKGIDLNVRNAEGCTPLMMCLFGQRPFDRVLAHLLIQELGIFTICFVVSFRFSFFVFFSLSVFAVVHSTVISFTNLGADVEPCLAHCALMCKQALEFLYVELAIPFPKQRIFQFFTPGENYYVPPYPRLSLAFHLDSLGLVDWSVKEETTGASSVISLLQYVSFVLIFFREIFTSYFVIRSRLVVLSATFSGVAAQRSDQLCYCVGSNT
jgi:hypothetical protein